MKRRRKSIRKKRKQLNPNKLKIIVAALYVAAEIAIYALFNAFAALNLPDHIYLKYSGVILCVIASCIFFVLVRGADSAIVFTALVFTAVSDWFILVTGTNYEVGLATFIAAQSAYFVRLHLKGIKGTLISLAVRLVLSIALAVTFSALFGADLLISECCAYIVMLACNLAESLALCRYGAQNIAFAAGLFLFLCCDICVGLFNFGSVIGITLPAAVQSFAADGMWAFYLPSQVIITLTSACGGLGEKSDEKTIQTV